MSRPATVPGAYPIDPLANYGLDGIGTNNKNKMRGAFARRGIDIAESVFETNFQRT